MNTKLLLIIGSIISVLLFTGCASKQNLASKEESAQAKLFNIPNEGKAGIYIYRDSTLGGALTKTIFIDDKPIAVSSPKMFFYTELEGDKEHKISTQSEFSPNDLFLKVEKNKLYFIRQYIKFGVFVGGANLEVVDEEVGKKAILDSSMELGNTFK
ncbi:DUF2846 domain-containing protein [Aliarcobacter butzleri]|uniref:DUF2846 domain-containing protein n=1 Tax=Aliarcobacter butzleri TaxID=28197 RepID=UPI00102DF39F|nr:DUF2846 domain-containing protein [Aliarcobacter butzleri]RZV12776.1 DUF2846 domain-containing protein [Aliarcobacter butzleri]RZV15158.1 DUF2846 domain-containing protein [Aliarcobacter butzleri]